MIIKILQNGLNFKQTAANGQIHFGIIMTRSNPLHVYQLPRVFVFLYLFLLVRSTSFGSVRVFPLKSLKLIEIDDKIFKSII